MKEKLNKINNELKIYINEASFISMKCRNKLLKIFCEEFLVDLDISNYENVDLKIMDNYDILYRDDLYISREKISSFEEFEERYQIFQEKADRLIKKKDINFKSKSNFNNISNLIIIVFIILIIIGILYFVIHSFMLGDYYNCLWFVLFIFPVIMPRLKESLIKRFEQAKRYLKSLFRK